MTQLKDVIHFLIGAKFRYRYVDWQSGTWSPITTLTLRDCDKIVNDLSIDKIEIWLRRLESITEDEKKELYHLDDHALRELGDGTGYALPYVFTWCLSKHFDLFKLIPTGQAIDADTLGGDEK